MKRIRLDKIICGFLLAVLISTPSSSLGAQDSFTKPSPGHRTITLVGMNVEGITQSRIFHNFFNLKPESFKVAENTACSAIGSSDCPLEIRPDLYSTFNAESVLPLCDESTVGFCVEAVEIFSTTSSPLRPTTYIGAAPGNVFSSQPEFDLPEGGTPLVFDAPDHPHEGGATTYAVIAALMSSCSQPTFRCSHNELQLAVQPFTGRNGELDYRLGERFDFADGTRIRVSIQVPNSIGGWFTGRVGDPMLSIAEIAGATQSMRITIEADSLEINRLSANVPNEILTPQMDSLKMVPSINAAIESGSRNAIDWVEELRPFVGDVASGSVNVWQLKSVFLPTKECYPPGRLHGLVTTNAVGYSWAPPEFNNGYFDYRVAGLHFDSDRSIANGKYDLIVNSETARCLYGFNKAPVSATVQVVGDQGLENIATTLLKEENGWIKLAAYGFTFSEKEIKVKLTQPFSKTISKFSGSTKSLSSKQKTEIRSTVAKASNNPKFICTGTYVTPASKATALARARAACGYAKSVDKNHSYFAQAKQTSARSYDAKVIITSK